MHTAAGGVGSLAVQLGKPLGAGRVIATASTQEKRALALELGADAAVDGAADGLTERLVEANLGEPVDVVFEMAGGAVFDASLAALAPFGRLVTYGIASGEDNTIRSGSLMRHSRAVVGFWFAHCLGRPAMIDDALADLFERVRRGELRVVTGPAYPLEPGRAGADRSGRAAHDRQGHAGPDGVTSVVAQGAPATACACAYALAVEAIGQLRGAEGLQHALHLLTRLGADRQRLVVDRVLDLDRRPVLALVDVERHVRSIVVRSLTREGPRGSRAFASEEEHYWGRGMRGYGGGRG